MNLLSAFPGGADEARDQIDRMRRGVASWDEMQRVATLALIGLESIALQEAARNVARFHKYDPCPKHPEYFGAQFYKEAIENRPCTCGADALNAALAALDKLGGV